MSKDWTFVYSTKIILGSTALSSVGNEMAKLNIKKLLIVIDPFLKNSTTEEKIQASLEASGISYTMFYVKPGDPTVQQVEEATKVYKENFCEATLGCGGGASLDTAKGAVILLTNPGPLSQYEGADKIPNAMPPIFEVPTTAGTGAEVSQSAILSDGSRKMSIRSIMLTPKAAFLDSEVVSTVPRNVAIGSGLDTLAHNVESFVSIWASPMSEIYSAEGIRLVGKSLRQYVANPFNEEAARDMQLSALLGAAAFTNSRVGIPHGLGTALGGFYHLPHGLACGISLPACMEFSWIANPAKYRRIGELLGVKNDGLSDSDACKNTVNAVVQLIHDLGIKCALVEHGVKPEDTGAIAEEIMRAGYPATDPRKTTLDDIKQIVTRAMYYDV